MRTALPLFALLALTASGCAAFGEAGGGFDDALAQDIVSGQTLVFVGTDPLTLASDIYLVRAVADAAFSEEVPPDFREAQEFTVDPLDALAEGANGSVVQDSETLFPAEAPFVVPDENGLRVLATSLTHGEDGDVEGGRLVLITITPRIHQVSPFIPGLQSARFTWGGEHLILQLRDPETGRSHLQAVHVDELEREDARFVVGPSAPAEVEFAEPLREQEAFLALVTAGDGERAGITDVVRVDPLGAPDELLTGGTMLSSGSPRVAGNGALLAVTLQPSESNEELPARSIGVFDLLLPGSEPRVVAGSEAIDCGRLSWSPFESLFGVDMLAFACRNLDSGRPDVHVWRSQLPEEPAVVLTATSQTAVPGGSVDSLVMRSGPQWDPTGLRVVFGASTEQEALEGTGMTVLAFELTEEPLDTQIAQAYPVYPATNGAADWVHFSAGSPEPILMLWDRTETGLEDTRGGHAIEVVSVAREGGAPRPVELGRDLAVSYPVFLGRNTLFYR